MCGIVGYSLGSANEQDYLPAMMAAIHHRGPDGSGTYRDSNIALGSQLLSIVDVKRNRQPFRRTWQTSEYICVYNGEVYNFRALRRELERAGLVFETDCDTEVALAAYVYWGASAVERFQGQWAMAVWERATQELFLSRDPFGIKPVYYWSQGSTFIFASEPKALFRHADVPRRPDPKAIAEYLLHGFAFAAGYSSNFRSFFHEISSLPPGHNLTWRRGSPPTIRRYFDLPIDDAPVGDTARVELSDRLRLAVESSTRGCLMGDVPVAVALSGGLDSSIIAAVAAAERRRAGADPLLCVTIRYAGQCDNEDASHARLLAEHLKSRAPIRLEHSTLHAESYGSDIDLMIRHFDEPHWEIKQLAMFNNYRELRARGAKVVLTGEGADELFFGYYHKFPGFRDPVIRSEDEFRDCWRQRLPVVRDLLQPQLHAFLPELQDESLAAFYRPYAERGLDPARCMQCWYLQTFLHWLLMDNDRCSMAHSLEGRFPFLNPEVFNIALQTPAAWQIGDAHGREKLLLREAFADQLPEEIWRDRKKAPMPSPLLLNFHENLSERLRAAIANSPQEVWEVLNRHGVETLADDFRSTVAGLRSQGHVADGGAFLTRYLTLGEAFAVRTPQLFGLLTLLRWWSLNFG